MFSRIGGYGKFPLIDAISHFPIFIQSIHAACNDHISKHKFCARLCGTHYWHNSTHTKWLVISPIYTASMSVEMLHFHMLYSPNCQINYFAMNWHSMDNTTARYCGHVPIWKESRPTFKLTIQVIIQWKKDLITILMKYAICSSKYVMNSRKHYVNEKLPYHYNEISHPCKAHVCTLYFMVYTGYQNIIKKVHFDQMHQQDMKIYDGYGISLRILTGLISSSHQIVIEFILSSQSTTLYHNYSSYAAPSIWCDSISTVNTSIKHTFYAVIALQGFSEQDINKELRIMYLEVEGFRGLRCEYGGVVLSIVLLLTDTYGPYCDQPVYESYSITNVKLPIKLAWLTIYSYSEYSNLSLVYRLQSRRPYDGDILPSSQSCMEYNRMYGRIRWLDPDVLISWGTPVVTTHIYFLPQITHDIEYRVQLYILDSVAEANAFFMSCYYSDCDTIHRWPSGIHVLHTKHAWVESMTLVTRHVANHQLLRHGSNLISSHSDMHLGVSLERSSPPIRLSIVPRYQTAYNYISVMDASCDGLRLSIVNRNSLKFLINQTFRWLSQAADLALKFEDPIRSDSCAMNISYQTYEYSLCRKRWYNMTSLCHSFWDYKRLPEYLCHYHRCYYMIKWHRDMVSWEEAQKSCKETQGSLIAINSFEELGILKMLVLTKRSSGVEYLYLGGQPNVS